MFSKMFVLIISFIGFFVLLVALIPGAFFTEQFSSDAGMNPEVAERFNIANVTVYGNAGNDTMTYDYSSIFDGPAAPDWEAGLPSGNYLEVWWGNEGFPFYHVLELRHTQSVWWGYSMVSRLNLYFKNYTKVPLDGHFIKPGYGLEDAWDEEANGSIFYAHDSIQTSIIIDYNQSKYATITDAWEGGELSYTLSYDPNWNASAVSASNILWQLLTFNAPDLGFHDTTLNITFNALIALPVYTMVAVLILKILFALYPTSPGVQD